MNDERKYLLKRIVKMDCSDMMALLREIVKNGDSNMLNFITNVIETMNKPKMETDLGIMVVRASSLRNTLTSSLDKSTVDAILSDLKKMDTEESLYLKELIK